MGDRYLSSQQENPLRSWRKEGCLGSKTTIIVNFPKGKAITLWDRERKPRAEAKSFIKSVTNTGERKRLPSTKQSERENFLDFG